MKNTDTKQNPHPEQNPDPADTRASSTAADTDPLFLLPEPSEQEPASEQRLSEGEKPASAGTAGWENQPEIPEETVEPDQTDGPDSTDGEDPHEPSEEDQILAAPDVPAEPEAVGNKERRTLWTRSWFSKLLLAVSILGVTAAIILGRSLWQLNTVLQERNEEIAQLHDDVHERDAKITELNRTLESNEDELKLLRNGPNTMLQKVQAAFAQEDWEKVIDLADQLHELYPGNANDVAARRLKKQAKAALDAQKKAAEKKKKAADSKD